MQTGSHFEFECSLKPLVDLKFEWIRLQFYELESA